MCYKKFYFLFINFTIINHFLLFITLYLKKISYYNIFLLYNSGFFIKYLTLEANIIHEYLKYLLI